MSGLHELAGRGRDCGFRGPIVLAPTPVVEFEHHPLTEDRAAVRPLNVRLLRERRKIAPDRHFAYAKLPREVGNPHPWFGGETLTNARLPGGGGKFLHA